MLSAVWAASVVQTEVAPALELRPHTCPRPPAPEPPVHPWTESSPRARLLQIQCQDVVWSGQSRGVAPLGFCSTVRWQPRCKALSTLFVGKPAPLCQWSQDFSSPSPVPAVLPEAKRACLLHVGLRLSCSAVAQPNPAPGQGSACADPLSFRS